MKKAVNYFALCFVFIVLAALIAGCSSSSKRSNLVKVIVSSELQEQFNALQTEFVRQNPKTKIESVILPLKELQKQVAAGTQSGIILTLGPKELVPIDKADKLAVGSQIILGDMPLVIIVPNQSCEVNKGGVCSFDALSMEHITSLAIGDLDSGSVGTEAMNALTKAKLWEKVKDKTVKMPLEDIVDAVANCEVGAAIVTLNQVTDQVKVASYIDQKLHEPIELLAVRSTDMKNSAATEKFVNFMKTKQALEPLYDMGIREYQEANISSSTLFMFCGAGLRQPATKLINEFRKKTGIMVQPTYTGSGCLLAQITIGQTGDLYMPGEDWYMDQARDRGFIENSKVVTYFIPVIMVQKGNPKNIHTLEDLLKPGLRIGVGEPKAAAIGDFTPKFLEANNISLDKFKKNVVASFGTAPELGNSVKLGAVDASIQWDAVAAWYLDDVDVVAVPFTERTVSPVPLGVLKFSKHKAEAEKFLEFVSSAEGKAIFKEAGHTVDLADPRFPFD